MPITAPSPSPTYEAERSARGPVSHRCGARLSSKKFGARDT